MKAYGGVDYMSLINTVLCNAEVSHNYMDENSVIVNLLLKSWGSLSLCQDMKCLQFCLCLVCQLIFRELQ
jgi:hypothetical protein